MSKLYETADLKALLETLSTEVMSLKHEIKELENSQKEAESLASENATLRRDTAQLQEEFTRALAGGAKIDNLKYVKRISEVLRQDLDGIILALKQPKV